MLEPVLIPLIVTSLGVMVLHEGYLFRVRSFKRAEEELACGRPESALRLIRPFRLIPTRRLRYAVGTIESDAYTLLGDNIRASQAKRRWAALTPNDSSIWNWINSATTVLITNGRYRDALELDRDLSAEELQHAKEADPSGWGIVLINRAEALHNLDRNHEAHQLLDEAEPLMATYPLGHHGLRCLRAWILIHEGALERAREILSTVEAAPLTIIYEPELEFTWAALERDAGAYQKALSHAERGLRFATRISSLRNGQYMVASILAAEGQSAALSWFEKALAHPYTGQSAYGLQRFAAFLETQGDSARASQIKALIEERDPESRL
jgi:tetratricopeptide (TPR) repeat protein